MNGTPIQLPDSVSWVLILGPRQTTAPYGYETELPLHLRPGDCAEWLSHHRRDVSERRSGQLPRPVVIQTMSPTAFAADVFETKEVLYGGSVIVLRNYVSMRYGVPQFKDANILDVLNRDWLSAFSLGELYLHGEFDEWIWNGAWPPEEEK